MTDKERLEQVSQDNEKLIDRNRELDAELARCKKALGKCERIAERMGDDAHNMTDMGHAWIAAEHVIVYARKIHEAIVDSDTKQEEVKPEDMTTCSAYDLISDEDRETLRWVRDHGGLSSVQKEVSNYATLCRSIQDADDRRIEMCSILGIDVDTGWSDACEDMRKRLMPEGMEWLLEVWPKWSNGEYCKFGDWWVSDNYGEPKPKQFRKLSIYTPEQLDEWGQGDGESYGYEWDFMRPSNPKYRPDKVELAADGVPIHEGDAVWRLTDGEGPLTVTKFAKPWVRAKSADGREGDYWPDDLTHTKPKQPDSWERIEMDACAVAEALVNEYGGSDPSNTRKTILTLVDRCKNLAEVDSNDSGTD